MKLPVSKKSMVECKKNNNMKEYRLIQKYPSLPKDWEEGMIVGVGDSTNSYSPCHSKYSDYYVPEKEIKDTKYWEQAIEDDYEILSILGGVTQSFYILDKETGLYVNKAEYAKFTISELLRQDCTIHSVKRLSDSEIFTVGDKVQLIPGDWKDQNTILSKIEIKDNVVVFEITQEKYKSKYSQGIQDWRKTKKPLFTTEDGVNIFEDDKCWVVSKNNYLLVEYRINNLDIFYRPRDNWYFSTKEAAEKYIRKNKPLFRTEDSVDIYEGDSFYFVTKSFLIERITATKLKQSDKTFSTREAAEEYILENKPCLSINDVMSVDYNPVETLTSSSEKLKKIVRSRL
jgi:hypothetical protein